MYASESSLISLCMCTAVDEGAIFVETVGGYWQCQLMYVLLAYRERERERRCRLNEMRAKTSFFLFA